MLAFYKTNAKVQTEMPPSHVSASCILDENELHSYDPTSMGRLEMGI
jgi:hypothetical protein